MLLVAGLGQSSVFTRPGERRLWVLRADEAALWDLHSLGLDPSETAGLLAERFGLPPSQARSMLDEYLRTWRSAGLLQDTRPAGGSHGLATPEELIQFPAPGVARLKAGDMLLSVAQRAIILRINDAGLRTRVEPLLAQLGVAKVDNEQVVACDVIEYTGERANWQLLVNGARLLDGQGQDEAVVAVLKLLGELGCRTAERLLVVHGAGLVSPDGCCFLLAATGGSGKTTLTMALEAEGYRLLSDDVIPIDHNGAAVALGLPACVKRGSWEVLQPCRADLAVAVETSRFGEAVRYLPPRHPVASRPCMPSLLLFPSYEPDQNTTSRLLSPEEALHRLVAADSVIRDLTQTKLEDLCRWVSSMPAYAIEYPSLATGKAMVQHLLGRVG